MSSDSMPELVKKIQLRTPARLLAGRSGGAYRTATQLELRAAHAAARDAVRSDFNIEEHLGSELIERFGIFEALTQAQSKDEYLLRPDLGRRLSAESKDKIVARCAREPDLQIIIGDGLSTTAVAAQVPTLLPRVLQGAKARGWTVGQAFAIRFCRVAILNDVGDILAPKVAVLLIGERPGLATAESLSAYMAFRPRTGHSDAERNLISNIHSRGVPNEEAATRILNLAAKMMLVGTSGVSLREELPAGVSGQLSP
jgi:ethanolamine ammonia-lyase small subunit